MPFNLVSPAKPKLQNDEEMQTLTMKMVILKELTALDHASVPINRSTVSTQKVT